MFYKELFEKICKVSCTFEELKEFSCDINEKEFDLDNPFTKYYSLDSILQCINLYEKGVVSADFVAYWANAHTTGLLWAASKRTLMMKKKLQFRWKLC